MQKISESVSLEFTGDDATSVAVIRVDNPPVNALSSHVRQGLQDAMIAIGEGEAAAAVLICEGRTFIAGADITEFGGERAGPGLPVVQQLLESSTIPTVAAIHGTALGGGLEVAMTTHFRIAVPSAQFGLPEVNLGLLPGAGGTQRLPRVTGPQKALEMMTSGDRISAAEALDCGLIDAVAEGDLEADAIAYARRLVADGADVRPIRDRDEKLAEARENPSMFDDFRASIARKSRGFLAPEYNIRCIEAAVTLPFDEGLAVERELFSELVSGSQSAAQRYYFFAERQAQKIPDVPKDTPTIPIETAGVLGAGTMGGGIAMNFANAGIPVTIVERNQEALDRGLAVVRSNYERSAKRGRFSMETVEERMGLITGSLDKGDFGSCDIVVEAVFENMDLKKDVFTELDGICKPGAVMASNTSALDVNQIAAVTSRPESVIGLHFFSPANVMKLLEVVRGDKTSKEVIATSMGLAKRIGKIAALVGVCPGFVGNRILASRRVEAERLILEGVAPARVDQVIYDFGLPMGPYAMNDLAGLDIGWSAETSKGETLKEILCESGRRGQKNGRGWYTYDPETRAKTPDPEVEQIVRDYAAAKGIEQREVSDEEILDRINLPMVNTGARILEEGMAIRASDVDVIWVNGYGWPVYRGGPMFWADNAVDGGGGLPEVARKMQHYGAMLGGSHWEPSPLLLELAAAGSSFAEWDTRAR